MRAVAKAFDKAFLCQAARDANAASFLQTIWSAKADAQPHVTTSSELPALPPIFLDVETTVARINREIAQLDEDGTLSTDDAGRKDKKRLRTERFNDQAREKAASNPIVVDAANRCCTVPKGAAVERGSDGELACYHCRINQAQQKQKLSNMIHAGGQNTFEKIEEQDKLAQLEKAAEAEAKAARAVAAKEKKEKVAEEKAAFEAALKACVLEMKACLRLRGARNRDEKIRRLTAVLADAAGAAKDVPGAHSQQKKELAKAKEELAKLEKEVADEAKAEAAAERPRMPRRSATRRGWPSCRRRRRRGRVRRPSGRSVCWRWRRRAMRRRRRRWPGSRRRCSRRPRRRRSRQRLRPRRSAVFFKKVRCCQALLACHSLVHLHTSLHKAAPEQRSAAVPCALLAIPGRPRLPGASAATVRAPRRARCAAHAPDAASAAAGQSGHIACCQQRIASTKVVAECGRWACGARAADGLVDQPHRAEPSELPPGFPHRPDDCERRAFRGGGGAGPLASA